MCGWFGGYSEISKHLDLLSGKSTYQLGIIISTWAMIRPYFPCTCFPPSVNLHLCLLISGVIEHTENFTLANTWKIWLKKYFQERAKLHSISIPLHTYLWGYWAHNKFVGCQYVRLSKELYITEILSQHYPLSNHPNRGVFRNKVWGEGGENMFFL